MYRIRFFCWRQRYENKIEKWKTKKEFFHDLNQKIFTNAVLCIAKCVTLCVFSSSYMIIRHAQPQELDVIMQIFEAAKAYMYSVGNTSQWGADYPPRQLIADEIASGNFYVVEHEGAPVAVFSFDVAVEPTYATIDDGAWQYDEPYGVVHRMASNGRVKGIADYCFAWCKSRHHYLRVDTHRDNATMLQAIRRQGFVRSGIITLSRNGDTRLAFEWYEGK